MSLRYDHRPPTDPPRTADGGMTPSEWAEKDLGAVTPPKAPAGCLSRNLSAGEVRLALSTGARAYALLEIAPGQHSSLRLDSKNLDRVLEAMPPDAATKWFASGVEGVLVLEP